MKAHYPFLILGGGIVAGYAVRAFIQNGGPTGDLGIITADDSLPYDRTTLSKSFLKGEKSAEKILINPADFYDKNSIDVLLNTTVAALDLPNHRLTLRGGGEVSYGKLLLATGSTKRELTVPGGEIGGVYYLRWESDARRIMARMEAAKRAVVIGDGFIGMEVASVLAAKGIETTVAFGRKRLMENHFFTPEMSSFFHDYYEARGVRFVYNVRPMWFSNGSATVKVGLTDGSELETHMVVAGVGVEPATGLFANTPLKVDIGLLVNEYLETNVENVYGAGDVIRFPDHIFDRLRHIEHWDNAAESGKYAAKRMLGAVVEPYDYLPYFFSDVFDLSYEFWGDQIGFNRVVYRGAVESGKFSTWWLKGDRVIAAFVMGRPDDERDAAQSWIRERAQVSADILMNEAKPIGDARKG